MKLSGALAVLGSYYTRLRLRDGRVVNVPREPARDGTAEFDLVVGRGGLHLVNRCRQRLVAVALD
jgi:hypothetical protein